MRSDDIGELVKSAADGDTAAFERLYEITSKRVYFICLGFLGNEHDASDALQDTFLSAYKNLSTLAEPEKFPAWAERIAVNRCRNILRANKETPTEDGELSSGIDEKLIAKDELSLPEKYITDKESRKAFIRMLREELTDAQYQTVILYYFNNMSAHEIAQTLGCSEGAVYDRLNKARGKLRKAIEKDRKGDSLFVFAGVPFLSKLFDEQCKSLTSPPLNVRLLGSAAAGNSQNTGMTNIVKEGLIMDSKKKIAITVIAVGVLAAGLGIGSHISGKRSAPDTSSAVSAVSTVSEAETQAATSEETTSETVESAVETVSQEEDKQLVTAQEVRERVDELMTAVQKGDIEKLKEITGSDFYDNVAYPEELSKIISALYGNIVWNTNGIKQSDIDSGESDLLNGNSISLTVEVGARKFMYYNEYNFIRLNKGDITPDYSKAESSEEVWKDFNDTLAVMPRVYQRWYLKMSIPEGSDKIKLTFYTTDFNYITDEEYALKNVREQDKTLGALLSEAVYDNRVVSPDIDKLDNDEEANGSEGVRAAAVELLKKKDYIGASRLVYEKTARNLTRSSKNMTS